MAGSTAEGLYNNLIWDDLVKAVAEPPAWEPKEGEWVKVTKPEITRVKGKPSWVDSMDRYDGKVLQVGWIGEKGYIKLRGAVGLLGVWNFDSSWLSPVEFDD